MNQLYRSSPLWRSTYGMGLLLRGLIAALVLAGISYGLSVAGIYAQTFGIALGVISLIAVGFITNKIRKAMVYNVSTQTIRIDSGILNRRREEFSIRKVQSIDVQQNILERLLLKTGDVYFDSAASDYARSNAAAEVVFKGVKNPHRVADIVRNADSGEYGSPSDAYHQLRGGYTPPVASGGYTSDSGGYNGGGYAPAPHDGGLGDRPPAPMYRPDSGLPPR